MHACPFKFNSKEKIVHICICVYVLCMYISPLFKQFLVYTHTSTPLYTTGSLFPQLLSSHWTPPPRL